MQQSAMTSTTLAPITVEDVKKTLTPDEQNEVDKPDFLEPLKLYLEGINNIPNPTVENRTPYVERARWFAIERTGVRNAIEANPHILKTEINPVVIIGLARTGTTLLQRLLASDTKFVSPMFWEVLKPTPPGRPGNWTDCDRYNAAKATLGKIYPGLNTIKHMHNFRLDNPEECVFLVQSYFLDQVHNMYRGMEKWKNFSFYPPKENVTNAYEYYKKALQCIFYEGLQDGKIPLLKAPIHAFYLDTYRKVFPNAKFIFPYRNAREMVGSGCSLLGLAPQMQKIDCSKEEVGKFTLECYRLASSRIVENIKKMPKESILAVSYSELVKDPMKVMEEIYSHFDWEMTSGTQVEHQRYMDKNHQHKVGEHKYSLEAYGITDDDLRENLSDFLDFFGESEKFI